MIVERIVKLLELKLENLPEEIAAEKVSLSKKVVILHKS